MTHDHRHATDGSSTPPALDPAEARDWASSALDARALDGPARAAALLGHARAALQRAGDAVPDAVTSPYANTIPSSAQPAYPGDLTLERRIEQLCRWNSVMIVMRAGRRSPGIGGHISTWASASTLLETAFHHHIRSPLGDDRGDAVFYQGHASPGIYARSFLEGRMDAARLDAFRREVDGEGLSSYPHPRLMPEYWGFSSVSMGLGSLTAIYQARFHRYLHNRGLRDTSRNRVWGFLGDGECDEPETMGGLAVASREGLDNLCFVVNCNLQRLDGPVRGNTRVVDELERQFRGAGWHVIKVITGSAWDPILDEDRDGLVAARMSQLVDGDFQRFVVTEPDAVRDQFFGPGEGVDPGLARWRDVLSDEDVRRMARGGHDPVKVHAAMAAAEAHEGQPVVILAKTIKGHGLGDQVEARNFTHGKKSVDLEGLKTLRDLCEVDVPDEQLDELPYVHPGEDSAEVRYLRERRAALGGPMPARRRVQVSLGQPDDKLWSRFRQGNGTTEVSTTGAFVGVLAALMRDKAWGPRCVPILCDEGRTFGMESMFKPYGIYSPVGQRYTPVDAEYFMSYREAKDGRILQEGITEQGSVASFIAAGTSYNTHDVPMVPFYLFYSMFGFQRTADMIWQAADMNARGFLLGCTAGRTTLNGEGLQHEDGHSLLMAATNPAVISYEPTWAWEIAVIVRDGLRRMFADDEDVIYYLTLQNEAYTMPPQPEAGQGSADPEQGVLRGCYRVRRADEVEGATLAADAPSVQLLGSGSIMTGVAEAQETLVREHGVRADLWSVTSYSELARAAQAVEARRIAGEDVAADDASWLERTLGATSGPIVAASDWQALVAQQIAPWLGGRLLALGTDGFGMSDTRERLRRHFRVDTGAVVQAARYALRRS